MALSSYSPLRFPSAEAPPSSDAVLRDTTHDDPIREGTPPAEEGDKETCILDLPNEVLYRIFYHMTERDKLRAAKHLDVLQTVCRTWKLVVGNVVRHHWNRCAETPALQTAVSKINALCNPGTTWSSRFADLTLHLRGKGAPIPEDVTHLGFYSLPYIQMSIDVALVAMSKKILQRGNFSEKPVTAQEIREWFNNEENAEYIENIAKVFLDNLALDFLPSEIGQLRMLENLVLCNNQLTRLPSEIVKLRNLKRLDLGNNQLISLPFEIVKLSSLRILRLENNKLRELPYEIGQLHELKWLDLSNNLLTSFSSEIVKLRQLEVLYLSNNQLTRLPSEIVKLGNLKKLYLYRNKLRELPAEIDQLRELEELDLSNNQLTRLPSEIVKLGNLKKLDLSGNKLRELPSEIDQLRELVELDLSNNQLTRLPSEIVKLRNLKRFYLYGNKLRELPSEISELSNLQTLYLYSNLFLFRLKKDFSEGNNDHGVDIQTIFTQNLACATYRCQTPLAKLCQAIHCGKGSETLRVQFEELSGEIQEKILKHIDPSQSSSSVQPDDDYLADEVLFVKALIATLQETFQTLIMSEKQGVYEQVALLAGESASAKWGEEHAEDNIICLIDAMALQNSR